MTKEEHIIYLENLRTALKLSNNFSNETMESLDAAIKELKQELVLDKVRAEIEKLPNMNEVGVFSSIRMKRMVLQIIDKYKEERNRNDTDK